MKERCIDRSRVLSLSRIFCPALPLVGKRRRIRPEIACILMQSEVLPHSGLRTDSPARQGGEGIVILRRVTLTTQAASSGALNVAGFMVLLVTRARPLPGAGAVVGNGLNPR